MQAAEIIEQTLERADSGMHEQILVIDGGPELGKEELLNAAKGMRVLLELKEAGNR